MKVPALSLLPSLIRFFLCAVIQKQKSAKTTKKKKFGLQLKKKRKMTNKKYSSNERKTSFPGQIKKILRLFAQAQGFSPGLE